MKKETIKSFKGQKVIFFDFVNCVLTKLDFLNIDIEEIHFHNLIQDDKGKYRPNDYIDYEWINNTLQDVNHTQLWIICGAAVHVNDYLYEKINKIDNRLVDIAVDYFNRGGNIFIFGDNLPFVHQGNMILGRIFKNVHMYGDVKANKIIHKKGRFGAGFIKEHPLFDGIKRMFEGVTLSTINMNAEVKPLIYDNSKKVVAAYYDNNGHRLVIDCGWTKLHPYGFFQKSLFKSLKRYLINMLAYLSHQEAVQ